MGQHYMNPEDKDNPRRIPNILTFEARFGYCPECGDLVMADGGVTACPNTECQSEETRVPMTLVGWFWQFCQPGCLPDSAPVGPFATEQEALENARE